MHWAIPRSTLTWTSLRLESVDIVGRDLFRTNTPETIKTCLAITIVIIQYEKTINDDFSCTCNEYNYLGHA